jgi:hypothetical protein
MLLATAAVVVTCSSKLVLLGETEYPFPLGLYHIPVISLVDSCKRTFDLGKWNLSTTQESTT